MFSNLPFFIGSHDPYPAIARLKTYEFEPLADSAANFFAVLANSASEHKKIDASHQSCVGANAFSNCVAKS